VRVPPVTVVPSTSGVTLTHTDGGKSGKSNGDINDAGGHSFAFNLDHMPLVAGAASLRVYHVPQRVTTDNPRMLLFECPFDTRVIAAARNLDNDDDDVDVGGGVGGDGDVDGDGDGTAASLSVMRCRDEMDAPPAHAFYRK
jgi:hypothetical protein